MTEKKTGNEANREMRNMRSGDDLNRYRADGRPKTNPRLHQFVHDRDLVGEPCSYSGTEETHMSLAFSCDSGPLSGWNAWPVYDRSCDRDRSCRHAGSTDANRPWSRASFKQKRPNVAERSQMKKRRNVLVAMNLNAVIGGSDAKKRSQCPWVPPPLIGNLPSQAQGNSCGRRPGGRSRKGTRKSKAANLCNGPAASYETITRKCLNVLNVRMIQAVGLFELRVIWSASEATRATRRRKAKIEANRELHKFAPNQDFGYDGRELTRNRTQFRVDSSLPGRREGSRRREQDCSRHRWIPSGAGRRGSPTIPGPHRP
jgi:hypothetical protein